MFDTISNNCWALATSNFSVVFRLLGQADVEAAPAGPTFFEQYQGFIGFLMLIAVVAFAIFLGNYLAKSIRLPEYGSKLALIFGCIFVATMLIGVNWRLDSDGDGVIDQYGPRLGIDLRGGINMIGSLNTEALGDSDDDSFGNSKATAADIIPNLLRRVDPSGTKEIMIRPLGTDKLEVTIPTNSKAEADEIWDRLVKTGKLQFLIVNEGRFSKHKEARLEAVEMANRGELSKKVGSVTKEINGVEREMPLAKWFTLAKEDPEGRSLVPYKSPPGGSMLLRDSRTGRIVDTSRIPISANDEAFARQQFTEWWEANQPGVPQVLLMEPVEESMRVTGKDLDPSQLTIGMDERGRDSVNFGLRGDGAGKMYDFTWAHKPSSEGKFQMAIVLDDQVHNWPQLNNAIGSRGVIEGNFTRKEIDNLLINLRSGNIDVALNDNPISSQFIESDLGQELKEKGLFAIGTSFLIVLVFMVFYYRFAGVVAALALMLNLGFIVALIMAIQQPLTLTGLAGLVLTVGMSVDANVLIFERIREELDKGAALRMAIRNGFDKATTTIVDANLTTLITAIVLYVIGTEQIKGFAVTLILGILMSMFTAIYCSRAIFDIWERKRWITRLSMIRMLSKTDINFISKRFIAGLVSVALIGVGIAAMFGLQDKILHHDLRGGSTVRAVFNQQLDPDSDKCRQMIEDALTGENLTVDGDEIEFSVSSISAKLDDEYKNRIFKIDSNLKSFDGEGEPTYEELAPLIARVFDGKLELLNVEVGEPVSNMPSSQPAAGDSGYNWLNAPNLFSAMNFTRPAVILNGPYQDEMPLEVPVEVPVQQPAEVPVETTGGLQVDSADSLTVDTQDVPEGDSQLSPGAIVDETMQVPADDNNEFQPGFSAADDSSILPEVNTDLKFKFPVAGKELTTLIVAAATKADFELSPEQVELSYPNMDADSSPNSFMSKDWTVSLKLPKTDDAKQIFDSWAADYNSKPYFPTISSVGGQIAKDTQIQALVAIIASLLGIIAYVWIRFQNVAFGLAAVVALIHDVLVVLGAIAISHYVAGGLGFLGIENFKVSLPIVAALLTIIGYSLNDTIVVFDRIREVRGKRPELNAEIVNTSISQTLSRTILTSLTTFIVVFILYCFGGDAIHGFAFSLVIGVIVGTYSSIFVASPVLLWLMNSVGLNPGDPIASDDPATA